MRKQLGNAAIVAGPFLVIASRAIPEERRGLRAFGTFVGSVLTAIGLAREYAQKEGSWAS